MLFLVKFFLAASAIIVIILVMLQRGKGGGLAGALGGMGGQSAFGTKAGDLFTKITVGVAAFWILISVLTAIYAPYLSRDSFLTQSNTQRNVGDGSDAAKPADSGADKGGKAAAPSATEKGSKAAAPSSTGKVDTGKGGVETGTKGTSPVSKPAEKPAEKSGSQAPAPTPGVPAK
jgi:preprotein translocase subunit SecG